MTSDSDRNGHSRQDRNGLGPKGESAGRQASPNYSSHRPEDVGLVEKVARAIHEDRETWEIPQKRRPWESARESDKTVALSNARAVLSILTPYTVDEAREVMAREMTKGFSDGG